MNNLFNYNPKVFNNKHSFYTILKVEIKKYIDKTTNKYETEFFLKIIYGYFSESEEDTFIYKNIYNDNIQNSTSMSIQNKCEISELYKPNENEKYYKLFTLDEAKTIYNILNQVNDKDESS